jgi:hypothetical protein
MGIFRINTEDIRGRTFGECEVNYPQHEDFLSCSVMQGGAQGRTFWRIRSISWVTLQRQTAPLPRLRDGEPAANG